MNIQKIRKLAERTKTVTVYTERGGSCIETGDAAYFSDELPEIWKPNQLLSVWGVDEERREEWNVAVHVGGAPWSELPAGSTEVRIVTACRRGGETFALLGRPAVEQIGIDGDESSGAALGLIPVSSELLKPFDKGKALRLCFERYPGRGAAITVYEGGARRAVLRPMGAEDAAAFADGLANISVGLSEYAEGAALEVEGEVP